MLFFTSCAFDLTNSENMTILGRAAESNRRVQRQLHPGNNVGHQSRQTKSGPKQIVH